MSFMLSGTPNAGCGLGQFHLLLCFDKKRWISLWLVFDEMDWIFGWLIFGWLVGWSIFGWLVGWLIFGWLVFLFWSWGLLVNIIKTRRFDRRLSIRATKRTVAWNLDCFGKQESRKHQFWCVFGMCSVHHCKTFKASQNDAIVKEASLQILKNVSQNGESSPK